MTIAQAPRLVSWARDESNPQKRTLRTLAIGVGLSLLLHALLIATAPKPEPESSAPPGPKRGPLSVQLTPPPSAPPPAPVPTPVEPRPVPRRAILAVPKDIPQHPTVPLQPPPPPITPPEANDPPKSMAEMVERARARQQMAERAAAGVNAAARNAERGPSPDEVAMANINRNLQNLGGRDGGGGIFQVLTKGQRYGEFSFRGWTRESRGSTFQVIEVDAGVGGDVERALVRRMIDLIRERYQGDFDFESLRLGRVVRMSARPADNAGLEEFMMLEFFPPRPLDRR